MPKGSCLCGAVRLEVAGELPGPDACHCSQCRKSLGPCLRLDRRAEFRADGQPRRACHLVPLVGAARLLRSVRLVPVLGPDGLPLEPDATFKAIFLPSRNVAVGYLATNQKATVCTVMSIADLTRETGVNPFPSLPASVTAQMPADFALPKGQGTDPPDCRPAANDN